MDLLEAFDDESGQVRFQGISAGSELVEQEAAVLAMRRGADDSGATDLVTPREMEVMRLLAQGFQNKEIAAELGITQRTVKFHVGSILAKLGAGNRTEAVTIAAQRGMIEL